MEISVHMFNIYLEPNDDMDFSDFLTIMHNQLSQEDPTNEMLEAFKVSTTS